MRAGFVAAAGALLLLLVGNRVLAAEPTAAGLWEAVDETGRPTAWFLIGDHGGIYDGIIAKMFLKPGQDPGVVCTRCRDDRHNKPWLGLQIIRGMKRDGLTYRDGTILDPRDGNVYDAMMKLTADSATLIVRGYIGISLLGRNEYWTRLPNSAYDQLDPAINLAHATRIRLEDLEAAPKAKNFAQHKTFRWARAPCDPGAACP